MLFSGLFISRHSKEPNVDPLLLNIKFRNAKEKNQQIAPKSQIKAAVTTANP